MNMIWPWPGEGGFVFMLFILAQFSQLGERAGFNQPVRMKMQIVLHCISWWDGIESNRMIGVFVQLFSRGWLLLSLVLRFEIGWWYDRVDEMGWDVNDMDMGWDGHYRYLYKGVDTYADMEITLRTLYLDGIMNEWRWWWWWCRCCVCSCAWYDGMKTDVIYAPFIPSHIRYQVAKMRRNKYHQMGRNMMGWDSRNCYDNAVVIHLLSIYAPFIPFHVR